MWPRLTWITVSVGISLLTSTSPVMSTWTCVDNVSQLIFSISCDPQYITIHAVNTGSGRCTGDDITHCTDTAGSEDYVRQLCQNRLSCVLTISDDTRPQCAAGSDPFFLTISHSCSEPVAFEATTSSTTDTTTSSTTETSTSSTTETSTTTYTTTALTDLLEITTNLSTQLPVRETRIITTTVSNLGLLVGVPTAAVVVIVIAVIIAVSVVYTKIHRAAPNTYRDTAENQTALDSQGIITGIEANEQRETAISDPDKKSRSLGSHTVVQAPTEYEIVVDTSHGMTMPGVDGMYADVSNPEIYSGLTGPIQQEEGSKIYTGLYGNME